MTNLAKKWFAVLLCCIWSSFNFLAGLFVNKVNILGLVAMITGVFTLISFAVLFCEWWESK